MWDHNQTLCTVTSKDRDEDEILLSDGISHATTWMWTLDMDKEKKKISDSHNGAGEESSLLE
jgi:hypothetical protein